MSYILLVLIFFISILGNKYIKSFNPELQRFINLSLLVISIWSIESIITPESCKCASDSLLFASLLALGFMLVLNYLNLKFNK